MRFLCVSDIHGHAEALKKVLAEAKHWGFDQLVALGDHCFPGPEPLGVWRLLLEHRALCLAGVSELALAKLRPEELTCHSEAEEQRCERLRQIRAELGELIIGHLARLPRQARLPLESGHEMLAVHGSPADPLEQLTHDLSEDELFTLLGDHPGELVVCGGDHVPFQREIEGVRVVGVGSVGEAPGGLVCHATLVTSLETQTSIDQREV